MAFPIQEIFRKPPSSMQGRLIHSSLAVANPTELISNQVRCDGHDLHPCTKSVSRDRLLK
jgi:hypothetical protein